MTHLLLDTNTVLWLLAGNERLGPRALRDVESAVAVTVSVVTLWEATIMAALGKLVLPGDLVQSVDRLGVRRLAIDDPHLARLAELPLIHRDPFDRMLIAQAQAEGMTVVTSDEVFGRYEVPVLDARN